MANASTPSSTIMTQNLTPAQFAADVNNENRGTNPAPAGSLPGLTVGQVAAMYQNGVISTTAGSTGSYAPFTAPVPAAPSTSSLPVQPTQPSTYTIAAGDTLTSIAQKYGTNIQALMQANPTITNPNQITKGSQLTIPGTNPPQGAGELNAYANSTFGAVNGVTDQNNAGAVTQAASDSSTNASTDATDPIDAIFAPIISQLQEYASQIMSPTTENSSLQDEYNNLMASSGLNGINTQLMNMQNVMNGTTDDIRSEVTQANGFATESQIQAMSTARNNVILKQYNALATVQASLTQQVNDQMQFSEEDQEDALSRINDASGLTENIASLQQSMFTNAQKQYDSIVTQVGYQGLAQIVSGDPYQQALAEQSLGLPQGTLSDPTTVANLQTFKQQQLAQGAQRLVIQEYNAGMGAGGGTTTDVSGGTTAAPIVSGQTTGTDSQGRPYSISSSQMAKLVATKGGASLDPGTSNITIPGIGYYVAQPDGSYQLSLDPNSTEGQYYAYKQQIAQAAATPATGSISKKRKESMITQAAIKQYIANPVYQQVSNAAAYLSRIQAAIQNPGSVSDADLLDAIVKVDTGGGQITEQQVNTITGGATWADQFQVQGDKIVGTGGVLSPTQRAQLSDLASSVFGELNTKYQQLYVQAMQNLFSQGIPANYWGNMPDFSTLISNVN